MSVTSTHYSQIKKNILTEIILSSRREANFIKAHSFIFEHDSMCIKDLRSFRVCSLGIFLDRVYISSVTTEGQYDKFKIYKLIKFYEISLMQFCDT